MKTGRSKANPYKGNNKFGYSQSGSIIPQPLTPQEKAFEDKLHTKYDLILGDFKVITGTNMMKPIWMITVFDGRTIETTKNIEDLDQEITTWLKKSFPQIAEDNKELLKNSIGVHNEKERD